MRIPFCCSIRCDDVEFEFGLDFAVEIGVRLQVLVIISIMSVLQLNSIRQYNLSCVL